MTIAKALLWLKGNWLLVLILAGMAFAGYRIYSAEQSAASLRTTVAELQGVQAQLKRDVAEAVAAAKSTETANKVLEAQRNLMVQQTTDLLWVSRDHTQALANTQKTLEQLKKEDNHVATYLGATMPDAVYDRVFNQPPGPLSGGAKSSVRNNADGTSPDGLPIPNTSPERLNY